MGEAQVPKDVSATLSNPNSALLPHLNSAFLGNPAPPPRAAV
jgi:hypothetical protein